MALIQSGTSLWERKNRSNLSGETLMDDDDGAGEASAAASRPLAAYLLSAGDATRDDIFPRVKIFYADHLNDGEGYGV